MCLYRGYIISYKLYIFIYLFNIKIHISICVYIRCARDGPSVGGTGGRGGEWQFIELDT